MTAALEAVAGREVDVLAEPDVREELATLETVARRVQARQCRLAESLSAREAARRRERGENAERAAQRAEQQVRRELTGQLRMTPSQAKQTVTTGRRLVAVPRAQAAFDAGQLPPTHARLLADTLQQLGGGSQVRRRAERQLLAAAGDQDPVAFGRTCRRLLAELDHDAAMRVLERQRARQRASLAQTPDGMTALHGEFAGLDGEYVATALHAFRRPDAPGEHRTPERATADAVVELCRAALRAGEAPTGHGVRPHVQVTLDYRAILSGAGVAETAWSGPLPFAEIRRLLADAGVSRLLTEPDSLPIEAGEAVRTVPMAVWRGLVLRDGGCIGHDRDGSRCDAPVDWCDAMHLEIPYHLGGRLSLTGAALGCRRHHRLYDRHGWQIHWRDGHPQLHPPPRPGSDPPAVEHALTGPDP